MNFTRFHGQYKKIPPPTPNDKRILNYSFVLKNSLLLLHVLFHEKRVLSKLQKKGKFSIFTLQGPFHCER